MNLYIAVKDSRQIIPDSYDVGIFIVMDSDKKNALSVLGEKIRQAYRNTNAHINVSPINDNFLSGTIVVKFVTDDRFIIPGNTITDEYRVFNFGEPEEGKVYPDFGNEDDDWEETEPQHEPDEEEIP